MRKKILVRGPCLSQSGYGEHARMVLRALRSREDVFDIYIIPVGWGHTGWISDASEFRQWMDEKILKTQNYIQQKLPFDISLQVTIPGEFEKLAPINIGVTAGIESTKMSPEWIQKSNMMDKIITISKHSKWSFENTTWQGQEQNGNPVTLKLEVPVEVVGYPVRDIEVDENFKLDLDTGFNYLAVGQWGPRKNMESMIKWWLEECWDQPVGLVLKTSFRRNNIMDREFTKARLDSLIETVELDQEERQCKVYLLHGDLTEPEMQALYAKMDCMITTTHGEGFGLPLFEFSLHGKPIIAPEWSGHLDFLVNDKKKPGFMPVKYDIRPIDKNAVVPNTLIPESMWCYPQEGSFKQRLRQVRKSDKWLNRAQQHVAYIKEEYSESAVNDSFVDYILGKNNRQPQEINGISFCIPTNGARIDKTLMLVKSIQRQLKEYPHEIIIAGDTSQLQQVEGVKLIDLADEAHGRLVSKLRNEAANKATYDTIVWCDDDIILGNNWLEEFINYSKTHYWNVTGFKTLSPDGTRYWDRARLTPHVLVDYDHPEYDKTLYQCSAFFAVRKEVFKNVKWDETKKVHSDRLEGQIPEDVQYSLDLVRNGYNLSFCENAKVWHWDDTYTEFNSGQYAQTLKKKVLSEKMDFHFFLPDDEEFENTVKELAK